MIVTAPERQLKPFQNDEACLMLVNRGEFSVRTPDQFVSFQSGKALLAKCHNFFIETSKVQRQAEDVLEFIGVFLFPEHVENLLQMDFKKSSHRVNYNIKKLEIDALLNSYKDSINILIENPDLADENMIETKLKELVLLLSKSQNTTPLDFISSMFKLNVSEFETTIKKNLFSSLSVDEFAFLCGMSTSTFKRKFATVYAESPKKYFGRMKMEKATQLLSSNDLRISEIAYDCGYETISTFNRSFKSQFGVSPSKFRLNQNA